jgi:hypothetical protein
LPSLTATGPQTRITTRYSIKTVKLREKKKAAALAAGQDATPKPPRGALEIKTYDPVSGVALKYRTTKAAEVSRLIHSLGRLSRSMAALPEQNEEAMTDAPAAESAGAAAESKPATKTEGATEGKPAGAAAQQQPSQPQQQGSGGGGKKKKKGKK